MGSINYIKRGYRIFIYPILIIPVLISLPLAATSQTIPVGQMDLDGSVRNLQLMGKFDPKYSFTARPFNYAAAGNELTKTSPENNAATLLNLIDSTTHFSLLKPVFHQEKISVALLPVTFITKFNSHHPYGWNDEGMIAARGLQTELSAGMFARVGPLSIQLQPQFVYAANTQFDYNASYGAPVNGAFTKLFPGQSNVRLNVGAVSLGYSTENLWWGPGQFSSLLLSNNAPGFGHFTFNTTRPVKSPIGSFEFQVVCGKLDEDSAANRPYEIFQLKPAKLTDDWRYYNGLVFSYQPSFLPGVFLGMTRSFQLYHTDFKLQSASLIEKYLPVFTAFFKNGTSNEDAKNRDQAISLFSRWLFPKSHAEFYFEYGWNDHAANTRDLLGDPEHSAAYIVGGKKLMELPKNKWLEFSGEITQMAESPDYIVRNASNWYEHGTIKQGLTNQNQVLGAGSGFGNNVQTLTATWLNGIKRLGVIFQRIQHDPGALAGSFNNILLRENQWNEVAFGVQSRWDFHKVLASLELQYASSTNYAWEKRNTGNLYALLKIAYTW